MGHVLTLQYGQMQMLTGLWLRCEEEGPGALESVMGGAGLIQEPQEVSPRRDSELRAEG